MNPVYTPKPKKVVRTDFANVASLRELSSDEWNQFKQAEPARFKELEAQLNGKPPAVQHPDNPAAPAFEKSTNGFVSEVNEVRYVNGIRQW